MTHTSAPVSPDRRGDGAELPLEQLRHPPRRAQAADTEGGVGLVGNGDEAQRLVGSRVQGADDDLAAGEGLEDPGVARLLLRDGRLVRPVEEQELGAEQPDPFGVHRGCGSDPAVRPDVDQQLYGVTVGRPTGPAGAGEHVASSLLGRQRLPDDGRFGREEHDARSAVDEHGLAVGQRARAVAGHHRRETEGLREDRGVAGGAALLGDEGDDDGRVKARRVCRGKVAGDEHERVSRVGHTRHREAQNPCHGPAPDVVEVGDPLGHVGPGGRQRSAEAVEGSDQRVRCGVALGGGGGDRVGQRRVTGHHRLGEEHAGGVPSDGRRLGLEEGGDLVQRPLRRRRSPAPVCRADAGPSGRPAGVPSAAPCRRPPQG